MRHPVRHVKIRLESLETRSMLSGAGALPREVLTLDAPLASQQSTAAVVIVQRQGSPASLAQPLQVEVSTQAPAPALKVSYSSNLPAQATQAAPGRQYQAGFEMVTFAPGQTTARASIPVMYGAANPGVLSFNIFATPTARANVVSARSTVYLEAKGDVQVPTITASRLIKSGGVATGVVLTFSRPMDPDTVQNVAAYSVSDLSVKTSAVDVLKLVFLAQGPRKSAPVAIKSATYDPATNSVTLAFTKPFKATDHFQVANSTAKASVSKSSLGLPGTASIAHPLQDTAGNLLNDRGNGTAGLFLVNVS